MGDKLIEKMYFGFLLLLPFVFCKTIVDPVLVPRQILLTVFLLAVVVTLIVQKRELLLHFKTPIIYAVVAFLFFNWISFFQTDLPGESHAVFSKLVMLFSFFLTTTLLLYNNIIRLNQLIVAVILFGLITTSFAAFDLVEKTLRGQHWLKQIDIIKGNSANKNLLSSILFLCLPFYFMGLLQSKAVRFLSIVGILSALLVLFTIRTRAAVLACLIFFLLLLCYKIKRRFAIKKRYFLGSGLAFILIAFFSFKAFWTPKMTSLPSSSANISQQYFYRFLDSKTFKSRTLFWENSWQMWQDNILLGVGLGNWQNQFPKYGLSHFTEYTVVNGESTLQRPHNDFIWILCETGILGLMAYLAIFGVVFYQLYALIRKTEIPNEKWLYFFILSGLIGYLFISFFDFPYERIEHQVIVMLLLAIVSSAYFKIDLKPKIKYKPLLFFLLIPIGYSFLVSVYRFSGEKHAYKMYVAKNSKNWSETIYEAKKADNYFYHIDNTSIPLSWYEGIAQFSEGRPEESMACFEKAYQLAPYNIQVISNLAGAYQVNGRPDEAVALYKDALKISPNFDEAKLNLAGYYFNTKDFDKAYKTIYEVKVTSQNPKYKTYLVPILNQKINAYLKTETNKTIVNNLVKNVTTKERLLDLFFQAKKNHMAFETYLATAKF